MDKLDQIFSTIKSSKQLTPELLNNVKQILQSSPKIDPIPLWKMSGPYRMILKLARTQIYAIALAGLTFFPYIMYQKYLNQPQKKNVILGATPLVSVVMLLPLFYWRRRIVKGLVNQILYDHGTKEIVIQGFDKSLKRIRPDFIKIVPVQNKSHKVKQLIVNWPNLNNNTTNTDKEVRYNI